MKLSNRPKHHPKHCQCAPCVTARLIAFKLKVKAPPRMPLSPDQTVFVRGHFRRGVNHLNKDPGLRLRVMQYVNHLTKGKQG